VIPGKRSEASGFASACTEHIASQVYIASGVVRCGNLLQTRKFNADYLLPQVIKTVPPNQLVFGDRIACDSVYYFATC
jgi:hypothetical protein